MKTKHLGLIFTLLLILIGIICVVIAISGGVLNENYKFYETESFVKELTDDNITSVNIDFSLKASLQATRRSISPPVILSGSDS